MVYTLSVHLYCNDDPQSIPRLKAKLIEAARIYRKDRETIDWLVIQDVNDPRAFTIVERFENEAVSLLAPSCYFRDFDSRGIYRARNTTLKTPTGLLSILMCFLFSQSLWIYDATRSSIQVRMLRYLYDWDFSGQRLGRINRALAGPSFRRNSIWTHEHEG